MRLCGLNFDAFTHWPSSFLDLKRPDPSSDKSSFPCLPLHTRPLSRLSPPPKKWKCLIPPFSSGFNAHFSLFHLHVLQVLSSEGNFHLGLWKVGSMREKFNKNQFSGRFSAQVLSHKCPFWVPFPAVLPRLTEQGILGRVTLKLPIGSPCDGHQEQGEGGERTTCSAHCGWGVDFWLIEQQLTSPPNLKHSC